jgi:hypothetical protein
VKKIIASIVAMLATISMMACGNQTEVNKNEGEITTTSATTTTSITTTDTINTTMLTTTTEVSTQITESQTEVTVMNDDPEPIAKSERHEEMVAEPVTETEPVIAERYIVYKPSTHYLHFSDCRWNSGDAYRVDCTTDLVARLCDECNPDVSDYIEYVEPEPEVEYMSDSDKYYIAVMLTHECSSRAGASHNAHSVAAMVNRVNCGDSSSIYNAIASSCCPWWEWGHGSWCMDNGCTNGLDTSYAYEAIDYYLAHSDSYSWVTGWCASGDGIHNSYH